MPSEPTNPTRRRDVVPCLLAMLLAGLIPLLAWPTANIGFNDDWSYARMAFDVAATGTYRLDGWAAAGVGPQAYWGALFVRAFGASALALRCSTLVLSAASAGLIYAAARRAGLRPAAAAQAAVACMLSPLVIPLSCSFMTDVPGLFAGLLAVALAARAVRAAGDRAATGWFAASLAAGFLGGLVRQSVWMGPLVVAPLAVALASHRPMRLRAAWLAMTAATAALIAARIVMAARVPYAATDDLPAALAAAATRPLLVAAVTGEMALTLTALLAPALLAAGGLARVGRRRRGAWVVAIAAAGAVAWLIAWRGDRQSFFSPWLGNILTTSGLLEQGTDLAGSRPVLIPAAVAGVAALASWATFVVLVAALVDAAVRRLRMATLARWMRRVRSMPDLALLGAFAAASVALGLLRAATTGAYDRYLLPALPPAFIALLMLRQRHLCARPSLVAWGAIAAGAWLGLAFTFDYHATLRACEAATGRLLAAGIPRTRISAGFEFDGETQLRARGYVNSPRIHRPPDAFVWVRWNRDWSGTRFHLWAYAPAIQPEYLVLRDARADGYADAGFGTVPYRSWFPPFRRELSILRLQPWLRDVPPLASK